MKILICSDIHGNLEALESILEEDYNFFVFLGDACDYGPEPEPVMEILKNETHVFVLGNHDNAVAYNVDCNCAEELKDLSIATRKYSRFVLKTGDIEYLKTLYPVATFTYDGIKFAAFHGTPKNQLYGYLYPCDKDEKWRSELVPPKFYLGGTNVEDAQIFLLGHTHIQYLRYFDKKIILNPGSLGQPRDGFPLASYAIIEDGNIILKKKKYDLKKTLNKISQMPLEQKHILRLKKILKTARV